MSFMEGAEEVTEQQYVRAWQDRLINMLGSHEQAIQHIKDRLTSWDGTLFGALKGSDR